MAEVDEMIDEIRDIVNRRAAPNLRPGHIAYIGDKKSPYDEGEHYKEALILLRRDIQPDDLRRFHDVEYILIIDTLIDERLSLSHFDVVKELEINIVRFGDTLPDFGPVRKIVAFRENTSQDDPGGSICFEKLLSSTSKRGVELVADLPVLGNHTIEGWLGKGLKLLVHRNSLEETKFRLSNCPNLKTLLFMGNTRRRSCAVISGLPRLEVLRCEGMKKLEIEEGMISLKSLHFNRQCLKPGNVVGLENCVSLHLLDLGGCLLTDLRTVSQNSDMKTININDSRLSSLVGAEYLHRLERLNIRNTPLAHEICSVLSAMETELPGDEDVLQGLLDQVDMGKVTITTEVEHVDRILLESARRALN